MKPPNRIPRASNDSKSVVENGAPTEQNVDPPPDGGYGWVCVAACFTINCFTWGVVSVSKRLRRIVSHCIVVDQHNSKD